MTPTPTAPNQRLDALRDGALIVIGSIIQALSVVMFLAPADLAPGGISGLALILNRALPFTLSIGIWIWVLNVPLLGLGIRYLGGWRFLIRTIVVVALYSGFTALFERMDIQRVTNDVLLNTLFGGIIGGVGAGLVFRAQATTGAPTFWRCCWCACAACLSVRATSSPMSQ